MKELKKKAEKTQEKKVDFTDCLIDEKLNVIQGGGGPKELDGLVFDSEVIEY